MATRTTWITAVAASGLFAAAATPWPAGDSLNREIATGLMQAAGLRADIRGDATLSLLPTPQITLNNIEIHDASGGLDLKAGRALAKLRLLPIIAGRFEVAALTLVEPSIVMDAGKLAPLQSAPAPQTQPAEPASARFGTVAISAGRAIIVNPALAPLHLTNVHAVLDWRAMATTAALGGKADWRGETIEFSALLGQPNNLASGRASPLSLEIKSPLAAITVDGEFAALPRWQFDGKLNARLSRMDKVLKVTGSRMPFLDGLDTFAVAANTRISASQLALSAARINVDDNVLTGTINFQRDDEIPSITGTLAASSLKVAQRSPLLRLLSADDGAWNAEPLQLQPLADTNMDLRLSTSALALGQLRFSDAALSANNRGGRLEVTFSAAKAYGGSMKARVSMAVDPAPPQLRASMQFENIDSAAFLREASAGNYLGGQATGEAEIRTSGISIRQMVQNAQGNVQTTIVNGALTGIDLDRALRQAQTQPLSLPAELRNGGRTNFRRAQVAGAIESGVLNLNRGVTESDTLLLALSGKISLMTRRLDLDIAASRPAPASAEMPARDALRMEQPLLLDLQGPWAHPLLQIDPESLINSSEAAAPLRRSLQKGTQSPAAPASASQP